MTKLINHRDPPPKCTVMARPLSQLVAQADLEEVHNLFTAGSRLLVLQVED